MRQMVDITVRHFSNIAKRITAVILLISLAFSFASCKADGSDFDGKRFSRTRHITVAVDHAATDPDDLLVEKFIHDEVLRSCNVDVKFIESHDSDIGVGTNADISTSENFNMFIAYARMNSVVNLAPYLDEYSDSLSDLTKFLGEENISRYNTGTDVVWYLNKKEFEPVARVTFIRRDWLDKLGLEVPSSRDELHDCLIAFRDNAELLLGEDASSMIPFLIDNDPSISAKPLFDSCYDTDIGDREFYAHGFNRATQEGYETGLKILNDWYLEGLIPDDFDSIRPLSKESYEPIENGYVGAFCAEYDYLYMNGDNSHIKALRENCGEDVSYIAVNTFENRYGEYTSWQDGYFEGSDPLVYIPSTCSDPLACLVYLNWISNSDNMENVLSLSRENSRLTEQYICDRYLITFHGLYINDEIYDDPDALQARDTALEVTLVKRDSLCVRYGPYSFRYVDSDVDFAAIYPDSTRQFACGSISAPEGRFDEVYEEQFDEFVYKGAYLIYRIRDNEWEKVMINGDLSPW